jgi:adenine-specific DNA methylase
VQNKTFRPIYYLGCKANFTDAIQLALNEVDPSKGHVCDLFSGSGVVGAALAESRTVTEVDIQEYSRVLGSAQLNPLRMEGNKVSATIDEIRKSFIFKKLMECLSPLIEYELAALSIENTDNPLQLIELLESQPIVAYDHNTAQTELGIAMREVVRRLKSDALWDSPDSTVTRNFGGVYFSYIQSITLDAILKYSDSQPEGSRDTFKAAALSTASQLVNTVGKQFAQPIQPRNKSGTTKRGLAKMAQKDRSMDALTMYSQWLNQYATLPRSIKGSRAIRTDYLSALNDANLKFSAVYADPPYTRDHYSRFYHVLETMCLRDNPEISKVMKSGRMSPSRGIYRAERHQSPFCIRSTAPLAFDNLFKSARMRNLPLVLSYSPHETGDGTHPRVVSTSQIMELANGYYSKVQLMTVDGVIHNKLNRNDLNLKTRDHAEILIKCFI